jgi:dTDP-4-dehydrorhamnose reductase
LVFAITWAKTFVHNDSNRIEQLVQTIEPVSSDAFPTPALRPLFSALDCSKFKETFGFSLPNWTDSVRNAKAEKLQRENTELTGQFAGRKGKRNKSITPD